MLNGVVLGLLIKPVYTHISTDAEWGGVGITDEACLFSPGALMLNGVVLGLLMKPVYIHQGY